MEWWHIVIPLVLLVIIGSGVRGWKMMKNSEPTEEELEEFRKAKEKRLKEEEKKKKRPEK
jgi:hypothetical protein